MFSLQISKEPNVIVVHPFDELRSRDKAKQNFETLASFFFILFLSLLLYNSFALGNIRNFSALLSCFFAFQCKVKHVEYVADRPVSPLVL